MVNCYLGRASANLFTLENWIIMSWEETSRRHYACPCGKGTYAIVIISDDWNRSEESWEMDCLDCKTNFRLYTFSHSRSGLIEDHFLWIPQLAYNELIRIKDQIETIKNDILRTAQSRHMQRWLSSFAHAKSKKEIWRTLTDNGQKYPSYSTMISHLKDSNLETFLRRQFTFDNLPFVFKILEIKDAEFDVELHGLKKLEGQFYRLNQRLQKEGFR